MAPSRRRPGLLRGLDLEHIIVHDTEETIEESSGDELADKQHKTKERLRASRHSGTAPINYDMKYHPMDVVTRPNSLVTQRHRSNSTSLRPRTTESDSDDTHQTITPGSESESDAEDELASDPPTYLTPRTPAPGAVRHSSRAEAQKFVNYSKKYHPQDHGLPGYQHKVRYMMDIEPTPPATQKPKKRKSSPAEDEIQLPRHARKHLRSLDQNTRRSITKRSRTSKATRKRSKTRGESSSPVVNEADELADWACISTPRPVREPTPEPTPPEEVNENSFEEVMEDALEKSDDASDLAMAAIDALPSKTSTQKRFENVDEVHNSDSEEDESPLPDLPSFERILYSAAEINTLSYYMESDGDRRSRNLLQQFSVEDEPSSVVGYKLPSEFDEAMPVTHASDNLSDIFSERS